jgi:hypothetical protein
MKTTSIDHERKVIKVIFSSKSEMPKGRESFTAQKRILVENGLTLMSGYAVYFDYEKTEKQLASIARKFDANTNFDPEAEPTISEDDFRQISRKRQAGSSLRK